MASLRKDPRGKSPFWYACISVPGKGQTQRSTKIKAMRCNRAAAMVVAERWERQARQLSLALHLTDRDIVLELFVTATRKAVAGTLTKSDARELLDSILQAASHEGLRSETVREFATHWLEARKFEVPVSTFVIYEHAIRLFLAYLGLAAMQPLHSVTTRQIEAFRDTRVADG